MVLFGILLIIAGALVIVAGVFTAGLSSTGHPQLLGFDISPLVLFLLGVGSGLAVLWGFGILKFGTRRTLKQRKERRRLEELSAKLERVEHDRDEDDDNEHPHS